MSQDDPKAKMEKRVGQVQQALKDAQGYEKKAIAAAKVLDDVFSLHKERTIDARSYLTGDSVADAAMLRAINIHADGQGFTFEQTLDFLYSVVESTLKLSSIVMLFF